MVTAGDAILFMRGVFHENLTLGAALMPEFLGSTIRIVEATSKPYINIALYNL